jgi:hypothetical protein
LHAGIEAEIALEGWGEPKILFSGGADYNDVAAIWDRLDKIRAKHPDMVLLHTGERKAPTASPTLGGSAQSSGAAARAAKWGKYSNAAAPFKRNDAALASCRRASSSLRAAASRIISPTRRAYWAFRRVSGA